MPLAWTPKLTDIEEDIAEEEAKIWAKRLELNLQAPTQEMWQPPTEGLFRPQQPTALPLTRAEPEQPMERTIVAPQYEPQPVAQAEQGGLVQYKEEEPAVPFWQRALQLFSAPFQWVDENVIKPGLSLVATGLDLIPETERGKAEGYWDWKRRTWDEWQSPGVDINVPWSDKPLNLNLKGVLELAPWLLIPGASGIGAGVSGLGKVGLKASVKAFGEAAAKGSLFKAARIGAGTAIAYSPWGLVEKTAGAAIKGVGKGIGRFYKKSGNAIGERVFGAVPEEKLSPTLQKLSNEIDDVYVAARKAFEKELPKMRGKQLAQIEAVFKKYEGNVTAQNLPKFMAELEKSPAVGAIRRTFAKKTALSSDDLAEVINNLTSKFEKGYISRDLHTSFYNMMLGVDLMEPRHFKELSRVFGSKFAQSIKTLQSMPQEGFGKIIDSVNAARAVQASVDLSGTLRQGLILTLAHPVKAVKAFGKQLKAFASEKWAVEADDALKMHPNYGKWMNEMGVDFTTFRSGAAMISKEENFFSRIAENFPLVRKSERAYVTYLNQLRAGVADATYNSMLAQGASSAQMKLMGKFINNATGRGTLPMNLNRYAPVLNAVLYSPRYQMSTFQLPITIGKMLTSKMGNNFWNPMRKEAARALVTFMGGGISLLALMKETGIGEVEIDPRSSDFGKLKVGETRFDIWRGYTQYARFAAQLMTGQRKSAFGNMNKADRADLAVRLVQSKASPAFGLFVDLLKGKTYLGDELFKDTESLLDNIKERILPLAIQDIIDAMEQNGLMGGVMTAGPAALGVGVVTYVNDYTKVQNEVAREKGYETWNDIDPLTRRTIEQTDPRIQAAEIALDRQVMGTVWGNWRLAGNAIEDVFKQNVNNAVRKYRDGGYTGTQFRERVADYFTQRRGAYDARMEMPEFEEIAKRYKSQDPVEATVGLGPEQLAIRAYFEALYGNDMYDEYGDYRFDLAEDKKALLRRDLGEEMYKYVEDYLDIRFDDFPQEFKDLQEAKVVMRPYWQIRDEVARTFGDFFAESSRGQRLISKLRKNLRLQYPEIARAYERFYSNT